MAKTKTQIPQPIPSTKAHDQDQPVESIESTTAETAARASTTAPLLQGIVPKEIVFRGDDNYYANHWGINE